MDVFFDKDDDVNVDSGNTNKASSRPASGGRGGRQGKPSSRNKGGSCPQSAKSTKAKKSSNPASVTPGSKPQSNSNKRGNDIRQSSSRMRGADKTTAAASASAPELHVTVNDTSSMVNSQATDEEGRFTEQINMSVFSVRSEGGDIEATIEAKEARLLQVESRNQELESRRRYLEHRCTQLEGTVLYGYSSSTPIAKQVHTSRDRTDVFSFGRNTYPSKGSPSVTRKAWLRSMAAF